MAILTFNSLQAEGNLTGGTFGESYVFAEDNIVTGIFINPTGTKLWMVGSQNDRVYAYTFGTAWNVSTLTYDNIFLDVSGQVSVPTGVWFKSDGTQLYVTDSLGNQMLAYDLGTAWAVNTGTFLVAEDISTNTSNGIRTYFSPNGDKMFVISQDQFAVPDVLNEYSLSTPWDITTLSYVGGWSNPNSDFMGGVSFTSNGDTMYIVDTSTEFVYEFSLSTPWDLTTTTQVSSLDISSEQLAGGAPFIKTDNTKMIISGQNPSGVFGYDL